MDARAILSESIVIDGHLDLLCDVLRKRRKGRRRVISDEYVPDWKAGCVDCVVSSLFCEPGGDYLAEALLQIAALEEEFAESSGEFFLAVCGADIRRAHAAGKTAIMLSFEGVEPLKGEADLLRIFHKLGVRSVGLCWSRANWAADGSRFDDADYVGHGLTEGGTRLMELMRELRMLTDVSHMNEKGFWQVIDVENSCAHDAAGRPVIASHSLCRALSDITRNLDDRQIAAIANSGGVIGINGISIIADAENPASADMQTLVRHMKHIKSITGAECLALGFDQCDRLEDGEDATGAPFSTGKRSFDIVRKYAQLPDFVDALIGSGFTEEEIRGFLGANLLRAIEQVIG